ncbi:MAG: AAA family ATPase [Candidatus Thiodiazotropha sp.]
MYESYFGFKDTPFRLSADEKFRYAHNNYLRASAYLAYALQQGEGFVMITGQPGSGKTTLVRDVISEIDAEKYQALNLVTSQLHAEELLRKVALEYGLPAETYNKATLLTSIHKHLATLYEQGRRSILFLDEAQNLSLNGLEELRLLSNLQQGKHSLLQIVLIGHDELRGLLLGPGMEHIQQRLIAICQIQPISEDQTREYIIHRLGIVGWRDDPVIQDDVYQLIHRASQGVPRNINHLMSRLLLFASLEEKHQLSDEDALTVIEELVDEQRISLAEQMSVEQFAREYRASKQTLEMRQAVGDHPRGDPLRGDTPCVEAQTANTLIESTHNITQNFLSAIEDVPLETLQEWDVPDSDWLVWKDDSQRHIQEQESLPRADDESADHSASEPADRRESVTTGAENKIDLSLPSADDIWKGSLDSMDLGTMFATDPKQGAETRSVSSKAKPARSQPKSGSGRGVKTEPTLSAPDDPEHRWGGVWFMSSENSSGLPRASIPGAGLQTSSALPSASLLKAAPSLQVEENLSMPSLWVDGCPEVNGHQAPDFPTQVNVTVRKGAFRRSLIHVTAWVAAGGLLLLLVKLFPAAFDRLWQEVDAKILSAETIVQDSVASSQVVQPYTVEAPEAVVSESQPLRAAQPESTRVAETAPPVAPEDAVLAIGDPDVSSYEYIEMAKRYFVYFDFNKYTIPSQYIPLLKSIQYKMLMQDNSFLKVTGYADPQGNKVYNDRLSLKRAEEVKAFFAQRGIQDERIQVAAVGAVSNSAAASDTPDSRRDIRRVEVILFPK